MSEETSALIWLHLRAAAWATGIAGIPLVTLGFTLLSNASETTCSLTSLGIGTIGIIGGYAISTWQLNRQLATPDRSPVR